MKLVATPFDFGELERRQKFQDSLSPDDPRHDGMFALDCDRMEINVYWGGYEYCWDLADLDSPKKVLAFLQHVCAKNWEHATPKRVSILIRSLAAYFRWNVHGGADDSAPRPAQIEARTTSATEERAKLTPSMRYDVLMRDDFRCRACGYTVEQGAHLHIDHIMPICAGGRTEPNNLQALCSGCNLGKGARR